MAVNKANTYFDMMAKHKLLDRIQSIQLGDESMTGEGGDRAGGSLNISFYPKDMKMMQGARIGFNKQPPEEEVEND